MAEEFTTVGCTECGKILDQEAFNLHDVYDHNGESFNFEPVQYCAICSTAFLYSQWYCPKCFNDDKYFEIEHLEWFSQRLVLFGQQKFLSSALSEEIDEFVENWLIKFPSNIRGVLAMLFYSRLTASHTRAVGLADDDRDLDWIRDTSHLPDNPAETEKLEIIRDWLAKFRSWIQLNYHLSAGIERPVEFDLDLCDEIWGLETGLELDLQDLISRTGKSPVKIRYTLELTPALTLGLMEDPKFSGLNALNISRDYSLSKARKEN